MLFRALGCSPVYVAWVVYAFERVRTVWDVLYGALRDTPAQQLTGMVQMNGALGHYGLLGPANTLYYRTP